MGAKIFKGNNRKYGVEDGGIIYEAEFTRRTAQRIAELENSLNPPKDWEETEAILRRERFKL